MRRVTQWRAGRVMTGMNLVPRLALITTVAAVLIALPGCKSPAPGENGPDPNIAGVSTAGLRLGMTPGEILEVSARRLYKEDQRNKDTLAGLVQKEQAQSTIRLDRVRTRSSHESFVFYSNAVTLTLQFARNRLVELEERHTGVGEEDLRTAMSEVSTQFPFVIDRLDTGSGAQWHYQCKNPGAFVRIDARFVPTSKAKPVPMSSYTIAIADPAWATSGRENPKPVTTEASNRRD